MAVCTVTCSLQTVLGDVIQGNAFARFRLRNFSGAVPRVNGTAILVQPDRDVFPDSSGNISTSLWGNDSITPSQTFYSVDFVNGGKICSSANYIITGASFDMDVQDPIATPSTKYPFQFVLETNGAANAAQGILNLEAGANVVLTPSTDGSGTVTISSSGGGGGGAVSTIVIADAQTGNDWALQVNAADTLLGSNPGEIWISPSAHITVAASVNITISAGHILRMFGGTYNLNNKSILLTGGAATSSGLIGQGREIVTIDYSGSGSAIAPSNSTNNLTRNVTLQGFTLIGSTSTGIGIDLLNANSWLISNFRISHFNGSGGVSIRIRGAGTTAGAYFNRFYNGFIDNAATAVLINYDTSDNIPTSYEFDNVHLNVVANGFDVQGSTGWFRDCYVENVSGIAMRFRSTAINHFLRGIFLDNSGSAGTGTGLQFDSGGSDNRAQVSVSGFSTNLSDSAANNHYDGMNTALWKVNANGTFTGYNAADADYVPTLRSGATADQNTLFGYQNHDGTKVWYGGQFSNNKFQWRYNSLSANPALSLDNAGNAIFSPSNGEDNALNVNLQAGSVSEQIENLNFLDKASTMQWRLKKDATNNFNLFDSNSNPRIGCQPGTNGFSSFSGAGTGATNLAFGGSGGTKFGNGDNSTTVAFIASSGAAQFGGTAPTVTSGQLGLGGTTAATATAGSATLPANPLGFLIVNIGGTAVKIPYYST